MLENNILFKQFFRLMMGFHSWLLRGQHKEWFLKINQFLLVLNMFASAWPPVVDLQVTILPLIEGLPILIDNTQNFFVEDGFSTPPTGGILPLAEDTINQINALGINPPGVEQTIEVVSAPESPASTGEEGYIPVE
jgi:hypothetical protein